LRRHVLLLCLLAPGCGATCPAALSENVNTVIEVAWSADGPTWIEYGDNRNYELATPTIDDGATDHSFPLVGLPALENAFFRAMTAAGKECDGSLRTDNLPSGLPDIDVDVLETAVSSERWLLVPVMGEPAGVFIIDREGNPVWYREAPGDGTIWTDVELSDRNASLLLNEFDGSRQTDVGVIREIGFAGEELAVTRTVNAHHMFSELPDGTLTFIAIDVRPWYDEELDQEVQVVGDQVVEIAPDGTETVVWSSWDALPVRKNAKWDEGFYPQGYDWTHANAIEYDPVQDLYLVSLGNAQTIVEFERSTGATRRIFGIDGYPVESGSLMFFHQHDTNLLANGNLLMFTTRETDGVSGAIEYEVDDASQTLRQVWTHGLDQTVHSFALGQARRLANGNTLVNWGGSGLLREVTSSGEVVWEVRSGSGSWFGNATLLNQMYPSE
jgi:hypothetical protein